jgi:hypothetical protein
MMNGLRLAFPVRYRHTSERKQGVRKKQGVVKMGTPGFMEYP